MMALLSLCVNNGKFKTSTKIPPLIMKTSIKLCKVKKNVMPPTVMEKNLMPPTVMETTLEESISRGVK